MSHNTVALAFSGGLDTTVTVPLLKEAYGYDEVIGVTVDVGQPESEFEEAKATAEALDVEHYIVDATDAFADLLLGAVKANATYQGYPLGTALARPIIAATIQAVAEDHDADGLAHGCTGKGNDQLRFEAVWRQSDMDVIAPVRERNLTREWEIEYAEERGLPIDSGNEGTWSIDSNLWSRSIEGGHLEDPGYVPPEEIYEWTEEPSGVTELVEIEFDEGVPVALDGETMDPVELITTLNEMAGAHGVGRTDMMEDRILGLKVRENYEHPAATTLLAAHEALESFVLTAETLDFKESVDDMWAQKAYQGLLASPLVDSLNAFIDDTQTAVTGTVTIKFEGGQARPVARESDNAVYSEAAASFNTEGITGDIEQGDATGVAKYHGFQDRLAASIQASTNVGDFAADGLSTDEE
ncbi:argininosuccinate synthase [Halodesulfurarchaeum sp.]|uniref:argininosuccinate synthase n=1 Tax=Halodesulfurarchaeum sp. TaxID=1980530 RepID=UPI001BC197D4|nr:argininosuccinate synthase [Halodesulfurarchaeum sp.]